jgi:glycerol-3-phosphate acyltransferase PlsY
MLAAGVLFLMSTPSLYTRYSAVSKPLSVAMVVFIGIFAVGACIFSCFFSVNETKSVVTVASKIHGTGSVIGFILMLFVPLFISILSFKSADELTGIISAVSFGLALIFFILFVMADKPEFREKWVAKEGLWQRLILLFMYLPLAVIAVNGVI